jgi:hypothetical protein
MKNKMSSSNLGVVVSVRGSVMDIQFDEHLPPPIYSVLRAGDEGRIVIDDINCQEHSQTIVALCHADNLHTWTKADSPAADRTCAQRGEENQSDRDFETAGIAAQTSSLALEIDPPQSPALIGELLMTNYQNGVIFDVPLHAGYASDEAKALRASWWLPDDKTAGTVVLFNSAEQSIS